MPNSEQMGKPYLVRARKTAEYGAPGLTGLVPGGDRLSADGADRGVGDIKVEDARGGLLKELAAAMA